MKAAIKQSGKEPIIALYTDDLGRLRDAADTILELGGSYTPSGTWTSMTLVTPVLGTPASGTLTNCTFPTLNQNTTGTAGGLTGTPSITVNVLSAETATIQPATDSTTAFLVKSQTGGVSMLAVDTTTGGNGLVLNRQTGGGLALVCNSGAWFQAGLAVRAGGITVGTVGTTSGVITLAGGTTGSATITSPAVAGTVTNPIVFSNAISIAGGTPTVSAGQVGFGTTTATSATAGTNGAIPAQVAGYLEINIGGTMFKLPYYAV